MMSLFRLAYRSRGVRRRPVNGLYFQKFTGRSGMLCDMRRQGIDDFFIKMSQGGQGLVCLNLGQL